tara:strand:- start:12799 stop:13101 length:303 start_codon:yes stop_codon:yes gene_type:complete
MNRTIIAAIFSIIFSVLTVVPNILAVVDDSYDISILIDSNEEEENNSKEKVKDLEITSPSRENIEYNSYRNGRTILLNYRSNNYSSLFKELTSPPPETNM